MSLVAQRKLEKECSLTQSEWFLYHLYFHPDNKETLQNIRAMTIDEVLSHKEALDAFSLMKEASQADSEKAGK